MLISSRFRTINSRHILPLSRIPNSQLLFSKSISCSFSLNSKRFSVLFFQDSSMSSSSSTKIVAEYAKSNRSSCKKCSEKINDKALRLGFVSRDARGFDMTRWFHSDCVSFGSDPISSADSIQGFELLEGSDQEALKKLVTGSHQSKEEDGIENENEISIKSSRVQKRDENEANGLEEGDLKKAKLSMSSWQLDAVLEASDIKDKYKDATLLPNWKAFQTLIFLEQLDGLHHSSKIAAFDFDGCLANTSVKRSGPDAWSLMFRTIPDKLQSLYNDGYKLVIFTNESNIERWKNKRQTAVDSKLGRLNNFINEVNVPLPIQAFIACGLGKSIGKVEDPFRKPKSGMWEIMARHFNSDIPIDMDQSFYVGDAAGRVNDHSDADIKFAQAIGLKFYLPEEYFGKD